MPSVAALLPDVPRANLVAEPRPAGTAAALTWAAQEIARRDGPHAVMMSVHADWAVGDPAGFQRVADRARQDRRAAPRARDRRRRAHPPRSGVRLHPARRAARRRAGAARVAWRGSSRNRTGRAPSRCAATATSGTRASSCGASAISWTTSGASRRRWRARSTRNSDDMRGFFGAVTPISVDVGVLERSDRVVVLAGDFGWDDVGTWASLRRVRPHDAAGNATQRAPLRDRRARQCRARTGVHRDHVRGLQPRRSHGERHGARHDGRPVRRSENAHGRAAAASRPGAARERRLPLRRRDGATTSSRSPARAPSPSSSPASRSSASDGGSTMQPSNGLFFMAGERHADFDEPGAVRGERRDPRRLDHRQQPLRSPVAGRPAGGRETRRAVHDVALRESDGGDAAPRADGHRWNSPTDRSRSTRSPPAPARSPRCTAGGSTTSGT